MKKSRRIKAISQKMNIIRRDFSLFLKTPKDFVYSFTYPTNKTITIEPYNPGVTRTGNKLTAKVRAIFPELKVHFIGSARLGILGQKDIDLMIECAPDDFEKYLPGLISLFGNPDKKRSKFIEWHFVENGCSIEILLIDPSTHVFQGPLETFKLLKKNKYLLRKYEKIKKESDGISVREYKRRRMFFFNQIMGI